MTILEKMDLLLLLLRTAKERNARLDFSGVILPGGEHPDWLGLDDAINDTILYRERYKHNWKNPEGEEPNMKYGWKEVLEYLNQFYKVVRHIK